MDWSLVREHCDWTLASVIGVGISGGGGGGDYTPLHSMPVNIAVISINYLLLTPHTNSKF